LQEIVGDTMDVDIDREQIATDVRQAQSAAPDVKKFYKKQADEFSDEGKFLLIITQRRILETEGPLQPHERDRLIELGKAMGLRAKHVAEALEMDLEE
jgi:hypothetical protein